MALEDDVNFIIALPYHSGDAQLLLKSLRWQRELCGQKPHTAILIHDDAWGSRYTADIASAAAQAYAKVLRYRLPPTPQATWPQGPNWAFQHTAQHMTQYRQPWLWLEADAIPMKRDWLERLEAEYARGGKLFMGYVVPEFGHMNGVAIYPWNTPSRIPSAMKSVDHAWDAEMAHEMIHDCHNAPHLIAHCWGVVNGKIHHRDGPPPNFTDQNLIRQIPPDAVLLHRDKVGGVIDHMRRMIQMQRSIPLPMCGANVPGPKVEILIVSHLPDIEYLEWNLKSIKKFCHGFSGVTLLVPDHQRDEFYRRVGSYDLTLKSYAVPADPALHHLAHQLQKCRADYWCEGADFIFHTDSDCIFQSPAIPLVFFQNGKPILCIEEFSRLNGCPWKPTVDKALGIDSKYETMRRHGAVHYRGLYGDARNRVTAATGMPFDKYMLSGRSSYPWHVSEFNILGNVALMGQWKDKYHFIDVGVKPYPHYPMIQFWSHSPPDHLQALPSGGSAVPMEIIEKALK